MVLESFINERFLGTGSIIGIHHNRNLSHSLHDYVIDKIGDIKQRVVKSVYEVLWLKIHEGIANMAHCVLGYI